ncbi:hypothetical protein F9802_04320 [Bacillus aerolatus]|uniref:YlbE-like protein n=1 Tax=Bacillus aerolatus TaxID=2653354 RepID=A0A6I1FNE4_9BACI|nr:YlbE-like family protein [Bacillus aerolatus]KAB7707946.1 hypothetical protein F9802_04320 [Bacillus aerolatus]
MRQEIMEMIKQNKEWHDYLRKEPSWYRLLSRHPYQIESFERASLQFHKKTFPDRVERLNNGLQMASALFYMMNAQFSQTTSDTPASSEETGENNQ